MSTGRSLTGADRTWRRQPNSVEIDPNRTLGRSVVSLSQAFISIKFHGNPSTAVGETIAGLPVEVPETTEASEMKKTVLALATAATIGVSALVAPSPAQAWRGGGWGWGGGLAAGLIGAAVIGGIASSAYAYGPGYGYYGGPGYGDYGGYAPAYYGGYAPAYYNYGYAPAYSGAYYGPRYRRPYAYYGGYRSGYYAGPGYRCVIRPAYAYYGPSYYRGYRHRW